MTRSWIVVIVVGLAGCEKDPAATTADAASWIELDASNADAAAPPPLSVACSEHFTLHGFNPQTPTVEVQPTFDTSGTAYCLTLDATMDFGNPDFYVTTLQTQGDHSPYELTMFDASGTLLLAGWDVTYGSSPPETFAHLETTVTVGTMLEAIVRVRVREGVGTTKVSFSLFEPFD